MNKQYAFMYIHTLYIDTYIHMFLFLQGCLYKILTVAVLLWQIQNIYTKQENGKQPECTLILRSSSRKYGIYKLENYATIWKK